MTSLEHYFENLLYTGEDVFDDCNKNSLSKEVQEAVETCAQYVLYTLFDGKEDFDKFKNIKLELINPAVGSILVIKYPVDGSITSSDIYDIVTNLKSVFHEKK